MGIASLHPVQRLTPPGLFGGLIDPASDIAVAVVLLIIVFRRVGWRIFGWPFFM